MACSLQRSDSRFTNHSNRPRSVVDERGCSVAATDIEAGAEITENYATYGNDSENYSVLMLRHVGVTWADAAALTVLMGE